MGERDWELDFEDFGWDSSVGEAVSDGFESDDDAEFARLFAQIDDVRASEEVRASTLAAILAEDSREVRRSSGGAASDSGAVSKRRSPKHLRRGRRSGAARPRRLRWAALAACMTLVAVIGVGSWFLPFSEVAVVQDELKVVLGVNVYGVTVTATAEGEVSEEAVRMATIDNRRVGEALTEVLDAYDKLRSAEGGSAEGSGDVSVDVSTPGGFDGKDLRREAEHVVANRGDGTREAAPQAETGEVGVNQEQPVSPQVSAPERTDQQEEALPEPAPSDGGQGQGQEQGQGQRQEGQFAPMDSGPTGTGPDQGPHDMGGR